METFLTLAVIFGALGGIGLFKKHITTRKFRERIKALGISAGMTYKSGDAFLTSSAGTIARLSDTRNGKKVYLDFEMVEEDSAKEKTEIRITCYNPANIRFKVKRPSGFSSMVKNIRAKEEQKSGLESLELECKYPEFLKKLLDGPLGEKCAEIFSAAPPGTEMELFGKHLRYSEFSFFYGTDAESRYISALEMLEQLAEKLETITWNGEKPETWWE